MMTKLGEVYAIADSLLSVPYGVDPTTHFDGLVRDSVPDGQSTLGCRFVAVATDDRLPEYGEFIALGYREPDGWRIINLDPVGVIDRALKARKEV